MGSSAIGHAIWYDAGMYPPAHPCGDPQHGPTYMLKLDLSDGFYRVRLRDEDIPKLVWPSQQVLGRNHSSPYHSHCPWGGQRAHPTSAAPPKPWWTSSIYMPPHPGTHHGILWNLPQANSPHWMAAHEVDVQPTLLLQCH